MSKILALKIDLRAAEGFGQSLCEIKRRRPSDIILGKIGKLPLIGLVPFELVIGFLKLIKCRNESLWRKTAAVSPKVASFVR